MNVTDYRMTEAGAIQPAEPNTLGDFSPIRAAAAIAHLPAGTLESYGRGDPWFALWLYTVDQLLREFGFYYRDLAQEAHLKSGFEQWYAEGDTPREAIATAASWYPGLAEVIGYADS